MKINKPKSFKDIIEQIGEINVFKYYIPNLKINTPVLSIFRNEKNPSFIVYYRDNKVRYKDFGNGNYKGDCIDLVCQLFNLNKHDAIIKIQEDFGLLKSNSDQELKRVISSLPITKDVKQKKAPDIVVSTRSFNSDELNYWNDYYQDISDLKRENIYVPKKIWINKNPIDLKVSELTFCYYYPENDKWKIYKPNASKEKKWFTNQSFQHIENLDKIQGCKVGIATKSRKDSLILKKALGIDCIVVTQAEDFNCWTSETVERFKKGCKIPYCSADNDLKGNAYSWSMTNNYQFKHVNVPYNIPDLRKPGSFCSDWADLARDYGIEHVYNHFVKKSII